MLLREELESDILMSHVVMFMFLMSQKKKHFRLGLLFSLSILFLYIMVLLTEKRILETYFWITDIDSFN